MSAKRQSRLAFSEIDQFDACLGDELLKEFNTRFTFCPVCDMRVSRSETALIRVLVAAANPGNQSGEIWFPEDDRYRAEESMITITADRLDRNQSCRPLLRLVASGVRATFLQSR